MSGDGWLRLASWMVPAAARTEWRQRHETSLHCLRILDDRGELAGETPALLGWFCRNALENAFLTRWAGFDPARWVRGPAFLMGAVSLAVLLLAVGTHGFAVTRSVMDAVRGSAGHAVPDRVIANLFPVVLAIATAALAARSRVSLRGHGWRSLSFLLLKTLAVAAGLVVVWIDGGAAFRACIPGETPRVLLGGLGLAILFVAAFDWAVVWSLADQQQRCPVCLRRLVMPVRIGSWASVFDPVQTEWVCDAGHGARCVCEAGAGEPDRWVELETMSAR